MTASDFWHRVIVIILATNNIKQMRLVTAAQLAIHQAIRETNKIIYYFVHGSSGEVL